MTYALIEQTETVSRRVEKFAELMQSVWTSKNDYERRVRELLRLMSDMQDVWAAKAFVGTYADAVQHSASFQNYKQTTKRSWVTEKQDVTTLFGNVQTKLKTYGLREYVPPVGLSLADVDAAWNSLLQAEAVRSRAINAEIRQYVIPILRAMPWLTVFNRIKDELRRKFADLANNFEKRLRQISTELSSIEGPLEEQLEQVRELQTRIPPFSETLQVVAAADEECRAANVDENDYTVFTLEDLRFELELVTQSISKKIAFIDNQVCLGGLSWECIPSPSSSHIDRVTKYDQPHAGSA